MEEKGKESYIEVCVFSLCLYIKKRINVLFYIVGRITDQTSELILL